MSTWFTQEWGDRHRCAGARARGGNYVTDQWIHVSLIVLWKQLCVKATKCPFSQLLSRAWWHYENRAHAEGWPARKIISVY